MANHFEASLPIDWEEPKTDGLLKYILECEQAAHVQKVPYVIMRVLIWFPTIESFYLQQLQHGSNDIEHCISFSWW